MACSFVAGTLNLFIGVSHIALSQFHYYIYSSTYLHLKVKTIIEFSIVKLEQRFILEMGAFIGLAKNSYILV